MFLMEGENEKANKVARAALLRGADVEFVAEITGLSQEIIMNSDLGLHGIAICFWCL
jgi:hypothetical protein